MELPSWAALLVLSPACSRVNKKVLGTFYQGALLRQLFNPGLQNWLRQTWEARGLGARGSCGLECDEAGASVFSAWRTLEAGGSCSSSAVVSLHGHPLVPLGRRKCSRQLSQGQLHKLPALDPELGDRGGGVESPEDPASAPLYELRQGTPLLPNLSSL